MTAARPRGIVGTCRPQPSKTLEVVPNPHPDRDYEVRLEIPEFTCLCPLTGQPDFATIRIRYVPDQHLVELKSIKLYLWSYRHEGAFHEDVTNRILDDFVAAAGAALDRGDRRLQRARRHQDRRAGDPRHPPARSSRLLHDPARICSMMMTSTHRPSSRPCSR